MKAGVAKGKSKLGNIKRIKDQGSRIKDKGSRIKDQEEEQAGKHKKDQ